MDLSTVVTSALLYCQYRRPEPAIPWVLAIGAAAVSMTEAKLSMAPMAWLVIAASLWLARRTLFERPLRTVSALLLPWAVLYGPWLAWTFWQTGSPWGPAFAGLWPHHRIHAEVLRELAQTRIVNQAGLRDLVRSAFQHHNLLLWAAALLAVARVRKSPGFGSR